MRASLRIRREQNSTNLQKWAKILPGPSSAFRQHNYWGLSFQHTFWCKHWDACTLVEHRTCFLDIKLAFNHLCRIVNKMLWKLGALSEEADLKKKNESVHLPLIFWRKIRKLAIAQLSVSQKLHVGNLVLEIVLDHNFLARCPLWYQSCKFQTSRWEL